MALEVPNIAEKNLLARMLYGDTTMTNSWSLHLFTTNITPSETDTHTTYTTHEAAFTGYSAKTLTMTQSGATWAVPTASTPIYSTYQQQTWSATSAETEYGYYILDGQATPEIVWAENFGAVSLINPSTLNLTPKIQLD